MVVEQLARGKPSRRETISRLPQTSDSSLERLILRATGARAVTLGERIQPLWGGYGEIRRATLSGAAASTVVVKYVVPPASATTKANGAERRSHERKLRSYEVERAFYETYAARCDSDCRVPMPVHVRSENDRVLFILEDLDAQGYDGRRDRPSDAELEEGLLWLASFHATFLHAAPESLWKVGCYWHLATRPDELRALDDRELKSAAPRLDTFLKHARFQTLVHGDAKLQNFCFSAGGHAVAAVDFQYVGGGVGVKDLAYFLSSGLPAERLEREAEAYIDAYFLALRGALRKRDHEPVDVLAVEKEWRSLYPVACADFYRFLRGWASGNDRRDRYLEGVTRRVLGDLGS